MNDELFEQIDGRIHDIYLLGYSREGIPDSRDRIEQIIALVEADVARRLLSDGAVGNAAVMIDDSWDVPVENLIKTTHAALEAALDHIGIEPEPGLDELLDIVPNMEISETGKEGCYVHYGENQWFDATADVRVYKDDDRSPDAKYDIYTGTGSTRMGAIANAVAKARKGQGDE